jgi:glucosamine--fructose-6-phosphate aminotransferase (isomerizing)
VASTKAYVAQLVTLALFSVYLGSLRHAFALTSQKELLRELGRIPDQIESMLKDQRVLEQPARALYKKKSFLFLGRGFNFPSALEGALKLKEISYAHAHGYAAGEMKHGPIALIDSFQPVVCIVPASNTYEKMVSNIQEIRARGGIVVSIATRGDQIVQRLSRWTFFIPECPEILSPILIAVPLQLFAYKIAVRNMRDVDQPRNLAKSVTVE